MLAEWITRGAGDRDSHQLLSALDDLGVNHGESAQTIHTSVAAATLGRNLIPALEIFADVVLHPRFDDDRPFSQGGHILAMLDRLERENKE